MTISTKRRMPRVSSHPTASSRAAHWTILLAPLAFVASSALAAPEITSSPDVTLLLAGKLITDETVAHDDNSGSVTPIDLGGLPANVDVVGYHEDGNALFYTPDVAFDLPGLGVIFPYDVVLVDGGSPELFFKGGGSGVPKGVRVDAVTLDGSDLFLSFDTTVALPGGVTADDEDLVHFDGSDFTMVFDGSANGVPAALDLDAAHFLDTGDLAVSFDGSGLIDGIAFDDEDVVAVDGGGNWGGPVYDASDGSTAWTAADLDALFIMDDGGPPGPLFTDGFESGDTSAWTNTVP